MSQREAWDREYSKPDPLWKGPADGQLAPLRGRVLELGCGNGKTAAALVKGGADVTGLDFSLRGLEACSAALPGDRLHLVRGDVRDLPFRGRAFDHVVAFHVLGHLAEGERERAVGEAKRVLRPGGGLLLREFSTRDMRCRRGAEVERMTFLKGTGIPCHFFEADEVLGLMGRFRKVALEEVTSRKRYGGNDLLRAELVGAFRLDDQR